MTHAVLYDFETQVSTIAKSGWTVFLRENGFGSPSKISDSPGIGVEYKGRDYRLTFYLGPEKELRVYFYSYWLPKTRHFYSETLLGYLVEGWPATATEEEIFNGVRLHHEKIRSFLNSWRVWKSLRSFNDFANKRSDALLRLLTNK